MVLSNVEPDQTLEETVVRNIAIISKFDVLQPPVLKNRARRRER